MRKGFGNKLFGQAKLKPILVPKHGSEQSKNLSYIEDAYP